MHPQKYLTPPTMSPPVHPQPHQATAQSSNFGENRGPGPGRPGPPGPGARARCDPEEGAFEQGPPSSDGDVCDLLGEYDDLPDHRAPAGGPTDPPPQPALQHRFDRSGGVPHPTSPGSSSDSGSRDDSVLLTDHSHLSDRSDTDDDQCSDRSEGSPNDSGSGHFSSNGSSPGQIPANGFRRESLARRPNRRNGHLSNFVELRV